MAAVNDRVTRFVRDHDLPVIVFGYGDCTGGAQASFVTHPLVQTYYFSGTTMPFAGSARSAVEPAAELDSLQLPVTGPRRHAGAGQTSVPPGAGRGAAGDRPGHPRSGQESWRIVVSRVVSGTCSSLERPVVVAQRGRATRTGDLIRPTRESADPRPRLHRGEADPRSLRRTTSRWFWCSPILTWNPCLSTCCGRRTQLICIGGNTPDESYLNAMSVLRVAELEGVDSLHPGIGFLSENSGFAS